MQRDRGQVLGYSFAQSIAAVMAAMSGEVRLRSGTDLVAFKGPCNFSGAASKVSRYQLGEAVEVPVVVGGVADVLTGWIAGKGANRDVYLGFLRDRPDLGMFAIKAGSTFWMYNVSLAEIGCQQRGFGATAICFYAELPLEHPTPQNAGFHVTILVEPAVTT